MPRALELERMLDVEVDETETVACDDCRDPDGCELQGFCLLDVEVDDDVLEELE